MFQVLNEQHRPSLNLFQFVHVSLKLGKDRFLVTDVLPSAAQDAVGFLRVREFFWLLFYFVSTRSSRSFYTQKCEVLPDILSQFQGNFIHVRYNSRSDTLGLSKAPHCVMKELQKMFQFALSLLNFYFYLAEGQTV